MIFMFTCLPQETCLLALNPCKEKKTTENLTAAFENCKGLHNILLELLLCNRIVISQMQCDIYWAFIYLEALIAST